MRFKDWAGYYAVCAYDTYHEREYYALRHAAGLIDVSPLFKVDVQGPRAAEFLSHLTVRDVTRLQVGQVTYACWCDERGKVVDDGTIWRLADQDYRLTAAEPAWHWLNRHAGGFDVRISDTSESIAALSLQGPRSRDILASVCGSRIADLRFFRLERARIGSDPVVITRTGYTGDLGFEIWLAPGAALRVYDALLEAGRPYGLLPAGLDAMDMTRCEAGFILNGVDYFGALHCLTEARKSTPDEIALGWTVKLDREPFIGQAAIRSERSRGPAWALVGLVIDWDEYENLFAQHGLPPRVPGGAWRTAVPVYDAHGRQVGQATSGTWSPVLKKNLALASVRSAHAASGSKLRMEVTVEYERRTCLATVVDKPFFDPERKKA